MSLLNLAHVEKTYPGPSPVQALRDVNLTINPGEFVAVVGPSGSGKSTLLNILALLDQPTEGVYTINGEPVGEGKDVERAKLRSRWFAFIFQAFHLLESRSVVANVEMGLMYRRVPHTVRREQALEAITFVGLDHRADAAVNTLSGGQRQRVAIARAIAAGAPILVADEPTGSLDSVTSSMVMDVLEKLQSRGTTVVLVTHDPNVAQRAQRRIQVFDGQVSEVDEPTATDDLELQDPYREDEAHPGVGDGDTPGGEEQRIGKDAAVFYTDILRDAWASLTDYPRRMIGMMVAVALGVAMSLATLGIGQSASSQVSETFDTERNTLVKAYSPYDIEDVTLFAEMTDRITLDRLRTLAGVESVTALIHYPTVKGHAHGSNEHVDLTLFGTPDVGAISKTYPITWADGEQPLGEQDVLLGVRAAEDMHVGPLSLSPSILIGGRPFRVVGLVQATGLNFEISSGAFIHPDTAAQLGKPEHVSFEIRTLPGAAQQVSEQVPIALWPRDPDAVGVESPPDPKNMREEIESNIATMLYTLTGVSIVAAIVALTNAMTTAVGRRTGEFGLRRAMGARRIHIALLVALESGILGLLGGAAGTILALLAIMVVTIIQRWVPVFDLRLVPLGLAGGMVVGVFSSVMAMYRAASIEPADALRR